MELRIANLTERRLFMDIKKVFKGFDEDEAKRIIAECGLTLDELPIAINKFVKHKPRSYVCDEYCLSYGKYHYMLNRVVPKIQSYLKLKLFS